MMIAEEAAASTTSDSEIWPTALWITFTWISSVDRRIRESDNASTEPSTSPFTITFSSWKLPTAIRRPISSRVSIFCVRRPNSRCNCSRRLAISRASWSVSSTLNVSPACGAPFRPRIRAGSEGPACSIRWLRSLNIAFTRPKWVPANTISPTFSVPFSTSTVETYPRPLSSEDSMMEPTARLFGLAFKSSKSASSNTFSSSSSTPMPFLAEISWLWYLPPQSSTR